MKHNIIGHLGKTESSSIARSVALHICDFHPFVDSDQEKGSKHSREIHHWPIRSPEYSGILVVEGKRDAPLPSNRKKCR